MSHHAIDSADPLANTLAVRNHAWKGHVVEGSAMHQWLQEGHHPAQLIELASATLKDSRKTWAGAVDLPAANGGSTRVFLKIFSLRGAGGHINRLIGRHRARRVWRNTVAMARAGAPVAAPLGYLVPLAPWHDTRSYFWSSWVEESPHAEQLISDPATREQILSDTDFREQMAEALARLHEAGLAHGDLKWANLLREPDGRVILTDLDGAYRCYWRPLAAAASDLGRFLTEGRRHGIDDAWEEAFVHSYLDRRLSQSGDFKMKIARKIRRFEQRFARNDRRRERRQSR